MDFENFAGNVNLKEKIIASLKNNRFPHAVMLEGEKGLGKFTFAKIVAKSLVCDREDHLSINVCDSCKKAENNNHPDIIFPQPSGALRAYNIDTIREIRKDAYIKPNEARRKVYIFKDIDNMGISAQNALLKILEEPPLHAVFLFTCISSGNILNTVKSRVQIFKLKPVPKAEAVNFILNNYSELNRLDIEKAVEISNGNIGEAIEALTSGAMAELFNLSESIAFATLSSNEFELLKLFSQLTTNQTKFKSVISILTTIFRNAVIYSFQNGQEPLKNGVEVKIADRLTIKKLLYIIDELYKVQKLLERNVNQNLLSTNLCSRLHEIAFSS